MPEQIFIAEAKSKSPHDGELGLRDLLFATAKLVGDWVSIHTDPRWGGSPEWLNEARSRTKKPILAKGIHADDMEITQAVNIGAEHVLVVGRIPGVHLDRCIIEPWDFEDFKTMIPRLPADQKILWNHRDLSTGERKPETFDQVRDLWPGWLGQASLISRAEDIHPDAEAFIVGKHLRAFVAEYRAQQ